MTSIALRGRRGRTNLRAVSKRWSLPLLALIVACSGATLPPEGASPPGAVAVPTGHGAVDERPAAPSPPDEAAPARLEGPPFPRIAAYRIETSVDAEAEAMMKRSALAIVDAEAGVLEADALARVREDNPEGELLAYVTSEEISHLAGPDEAPLAAERFERIAPSHWLVEPGSMLAAPVAPDDTRLRVADPAAFSVTRPPSAFYPPDEPTFLLLGDEHVRLVAVEGDELVVERGYRSRPGSHPAGTKVAAHVVFFAGTWMLNVAATAPADPERGRFTDLLAAEAEALVARGPWTGVFLDVCFEDVGFLNGGVLDVDGDGARDDPSVASAAWSAGMRQLVDDLRRRLGPQTPILANPGAQNCPHPNLDGILLEGWPIGLPDGYLAFERGLERYLGWAARSGREAFSVANAFSPAIGFGVIAEGADEQARRDYRAMRFGLGVALMGDGYYSFDNGVFGHYVAWWYDEYDGAGRGEGWLGYPREPFRRDASGALMRRFDRGLAIVNPTDAPVTVAVPPGYARLRGTQDPEHNDGRPVEGALTIAPRDAFILATVD